MTEFNLWIESAILVAVFALVVLVPCYFIAIFGRKLIEELSRYPSQAPSIHMKYLTPVLVIEFFTFLGLIGIYQVFIKSVP